MRRYVDVDVDQRDGRDAYLILNNNNELKECLVGCDAFSSCVIKGEKRRRTSALTTDLSRSIARIF